MIAELEGYINKNYDLILNTSRMDLDKIVEVIKTYVSLR